MPDLAVKETEVGKFDWSQAETCTNDTSAYGLLHMAGNVSEWVSDVYSNDYYGMSEMRDPAGPDEGKIHLYRGGSYLSTKQEELSAVLRGHPQNQRMESGCTQDGRPVIGIRCAKSLSIVVQPVVPAVKKDATIAEVGKEPPVVGKETVPSATRPIQEQKLPSAKKNESLKRVTPLLNRGVGHAP